jgi:site-specific DNA recombinase
MTRRCIVRPLAESDLDHATTWYNDQQSGLGLRFLDAVDQVFDRIRATATEPIDDTSTKKLMEGVLAAFAQFDNDARSDRTRAGMQAALELGRWTFLAPLGYTNAPRAMGKSLILDSERAPLVRRAFQEFATGRFTKHEVRKAVIALGLKTRRGQPVPSQTFDSMLRNRV